MTELAVALGQLDVWVRLHYVYLSACDEVIPLMAEANFALLDIRFRRQQAHLKLMKRPANAENVLERIKKWREICPEITLRSTFIVGFPGRDEEEFERAARLPRRSATGCVGALCIHRRGCGSQRTGDISTRSAEERSDADAASGGNQRRASQTKIGKT